MNPKNRVSRPLGKKWGLGLWRWLIVSKNSLSANVGWISLFVALLAVVGPGYNAYTNGKNFDFQRKTKQEDAVKRDTDILYYAIEQAESHACAAASSRVGSHTFSMYLELAKVNEVKCRVNAPVFVYHALADLGRNVFDFDTIEEYCELAYEKSNDNFERSLSLQQLASAHFDFHEFSESESAHLGTARLKFQEAVDLLELSKGRLVREVGLAYELWAAHEAYHDHADKAERLKTLAIHAWSSLPDVDRLPMEAELESHVSVAAQGVHPRSPCRLRVMTVTGVPTNAPLLSAPPAEITEPEITNISQDKSLGVMTPEGNLHMIYLQPAIRDGRPTSITVDVLLDPDKEIPPRHYIPVDDKNAIPQVRLESRMEANEAFANCEC